MNCPYKKDNEVSRSMKVALVHDWLTGMRGGDSYECASRTLRDELRKCLEILVSLFRRQLYTLCYINKG